MADTKVSALTDGTTANATDRIPVARSPFGSGDNRYITPAYLDTYMASTTKTLTNKTLTSPVLTTPTLGVASATSINKITLTAPATGSTLTIADGKTLTANNSITFAGTDSTTMTFPSTSATIARTDAGNTFTGAQTISGGTVNGTVLSVSQTWGSTGTYTGLLYNVTDSGPANTASLLMDLQVGGASKASVKKDGTITAAGPVLVPDGSNASPTLAFSGATGQGFYRSGTATVFASSGADIFWQGASYFTMRSNMSLAWSSGTTAGSAQDTILTRAAAATLQLGAADSGAATAQTLQVQSSTGTDIAGADWSLNLSRGTGTGAGGKLVISGAVTGTTGTSQNARVRGLDFVPPTSSSAGGAFNIYNTYTDASNYEVLTVRWSGNVAGIFTNGLGTGTGTPRNLQLGSLLAANVDIVYNGSAVWRWSSGNLICPTDNTYDIGASGATRPRTAYIGTSVVLGTSTNISTLTSPGANLIGIGGSTSSFPALKRSAAVLEVRLADDSGYANLNVQALSCSQGVLIGSSNTVSWNGAASYVFGNATTGALTGTMRIVASGGTTCINFGGDTSSFPTLKRSSTALHVRLADDSAYAPLSAELVTVAAGTATPAGGSTAARLLMGTTSGFGIYYGSGAPTVSAAKGSLYLRSDGSTTNDRTYINTDGATTWTAITTAA